MRVNIGKNSRIALLAVISFFYFACHHQQLKGSGVLATRELELTGVKIIKINGVGDFFITDAQEENLVIKADDNILPYIASEVKNDELLLSIDKNVNISAVTPLVFNINLKNMTEISAEGTGNIEIASLKTDHLNINLNGSTQLKANVTVDEINITTSGSCKVTLHGTADDQTFVLKGSSTINGSDLLGKTGTLTAHGSAAIKLNITEKISGSISDSVEVRYKNDPTREVTTSGISSIKTF